MKPNYIPADLDDILFENRERRYGAFPLRKNYPQLLMGVTAIVLGCVLSLGFVVNGNLIAPVKEERIKIYSCPGLLDVSEEEIDLAIFFEEYRTMGNTPPMPPKVSLSIPRPAKKVEKEMLVEGGILPKEIPLPNIDVADLKIGFEEEEIISPQDCPCCSDKSRNAIEEKEEPGFDEFIVAEEPHPINIETIKREIGNPCRGCGCVEGTVVIRMLVDKNGNYLKHKIIKEIHPIFSEECEKHIHKLKFTPAIQRGKPICFWVNIPFRFRMM